MAEDKVVLAVSDVSVHRHLGPPRKSKDGREVYEVEGVLLGPGDTIPLDEVAPYQREQLASDEFKATRVVSAEKAEEIKAEAAALRGAPAGVELEPGQSALPDDSSYSDHLMSDVERVANLRGLAEATSGESAAAPRQTSAPPAPKE